MADEPVGRTMACAPGPGRVQLETCIKSAARSISDPLQPSAWDGGKVLENMGGDHKLREIVDIFLEQTPKLLARLQLGVSIGDARTVETTAHSLKGELSCLGASAADRARELERMGRENDPQGTAALFATFENELAKLMKEIRIQVHGEAAHGG